MDHISGPLPGEILAYYTLRGGKSCAALAVLLFYDMTLHYARL